MSVSQTIKDVLLQAGLDEARWVRINAQLMGRGTLYRGSSDAQERLYDEALRIKDFLTEFWSTLGYRLIHDANVDYLQLYPPGAGIPGVEQEEEFEVERAVRRRIGPDLAAMIVIMRFLYDQKITQGNEIGIQGDVPVTIEEIALAMMSHLKRRLPDSLVERHRLLRELRFRELARFIDEEIQGGKEGAIIAILPTIQGVMSRDVCARAIEAVKNPTAEGQAGPKDESATRIDSNGNT